MFHLPTTQRSVFLGLLAASVLVAGCGDTAEKGDKTGGKSSDPAKPSQAGAPTTPQPDTPSDVQPKPPAEKAVKPAEPPPAKPESAKPLSEPGETEPASAKEPSGPGSADQPAAKDAANPKAKEDDEDTFSLEEIEKRRKLIEEEMAKEEAKWAQQQKKRIAELGPPLVDNADKLVRLDAVFPVWSDPQNKRVVMVGEVCKREGPLEMFACLRRTKEHEAVVVVDTKAQVVHAGLLAVGAKNGRPVQYDPEYKPATGDEIEVSLAWKDKQGKAQTARAQDWVRHAGSKKAMEHPWVFAGSAFTKDEVTGQTLYMADGGDFICVSNFGSAMLDLPVRSSDLNRELEFQAFTERIPEEGTPVTVLLTPKKKAAEKAPGEAKEKPASEAKPPDEKK